MKSIFLTSGVVICSLLAYKAFLSSPSESIGDLSTTFKGTRKTLTQLSLTNQNNAANAIVSPVYYSTGSPFTTNLPSTGIVLKTGQLFSTASTQYRLPLDYRQYARPRATSNDHFAMQIGTLWGISSSNRSFIIINENSLASVLDDVLIDEDAESIATADTIVSSVTISSENGGIEPPSPIPTPALLPGLIGIGLAAIRKYRQEEEQENVQSR